MKEQILKIEIAKDQKEIALIKFKTVVYLFITFLVIVGIVWSCFIS